MSALLDEIKNQWLKDWANQELNGYASAKDTPDYRIVPALARGNFVGPFHAQYNRHLIPSAVLQEKDRVFAQEVYLVQSVGAYQDMLRRSAETHGTIVFNWDPKWSAITKPRSSRISCVTRPGKN
jgi:hypothetical protein